MRSLRSPLNHVDLVIRPSLGGVDLILDAFTGVLFVSLFTLPSKGPAVLERISACSQSYSQLFIIFEAYPEKRTFKARPSGDTGDDPYAYTPPIIKAIRKLRRDISIASATGSKDPNCDTRWAFADSVEESAKFVRTFGDLAESGCAESERVLWSGGREWLDGDASEVGVAHLI